MSNEIGDVKPTSMKHLIGQRGVLDQVAVAVDAAFADAKKFDHALLVGPPGLGKSQTAFVISQEMATGFHEVLGQSIACPADLNALLLGAQDKDVIHIDEAHELDREFQTVLYLALDQRKLTLGGCGRNSTSSRTARCLPRSSGSAGESCPPCRPLRRPLRPRRRPRRCPRWSSRPRRRHRRTLHRSRRRPQRGGYRAGRLGPLRWPRSCSAERLPRGTCPGGGSRRVLPGPPSPSCRSGTSARIRRTRTSPGGSTTSC